MPLQCGFDPRGDLLAMLSGARHNFCVADHAGTSESVFSDETLRKYKATNVALRTDCQHERQIDTAPVVARLRRCPGEHP